MAEEHNNTSTRGLRQLLGELDFDDWAFASQAKLGKKGLVAPFVEKLSDTTVAAATVAEIVSQIVRGSAKLGP